MSPLSPIPGEQLTSALNRLNIRFIVDSQSGEEKLSAQPTRLIAALAQSDEARLRLALIPLFLEHPEFALHAPRAADLLSPDARLTLQCYYTAARFLQQLLFPGETSLPDYFSQELNLSLTQDPMENLRLLAKRHRELSGMQVNWLGTYLHAAQVWRKGAAHKEHLSK